MRLNSGIILAGRPVNAVNALSQGMQLASSENEMQHRNKLMPFELQSAEQGIQMNALNMDATRQRMEMARRADARAAAAAGRARANHQRALEAQEAQQRVRNAIQLIDSAQTPEQWDQLAAQHDPSLVGQFGNKRALLGRLMPLEQRLQMEIEAQQGPEPDYKMVNGQFVDMNNPQAGAQDIPGLRQDAPAPLSPQGKLFADLEAGRITQEQFDTANQPRGPLVQNVIGGEQGLGPISTLPPDPESNVPEGSGRGSFGLGGAIVNGLNTVSDFVLGREIAPTTAENTRFFKNFEEDALVGLSQAYGRQPAQQLMNNLRSLLPNVGRDGPQGAYREAVIMRDRFMRDLGTARSAASRARTPTQAQESEQRALGLESAIAQFDEAIRRLQPAGGATVDQSDEDLMNQLLGGE